MSIDRQLFRQIAGRFATGVTVVTAMVDGQPYGMTVNAFTSVSLDPTLVLVSIDHRTQCRTVIPRAGAFAVNILTEEQADISHQFATRVEDRFAGVAWRVSQHGLPVLGDTLATLECKLYSAVEAGDHTLFIGEVIDAHVGEGEPLLFYRSGYRALVDLESVALV